MSWRPAQERPIQPSRSSGGSPLPEQLRRRAWAEDPEGITGDTLSEFVNSQLFPTLKEKLVIHGPAGERARVVRNVFEDACNYMKSGTLLRQVINKISEIDFNNSGDRHTFGGIYERIIRDPDELLANYRRIMAEADDIRERLKAQLTAALGRGG